MALLYSFRRLELQAFTAHVQNAEAIPRRLVYYQFILMVW